MLLLQLFTMTGFAVVAFQDFKERAITWILLPILGILLASLHIWHVGIEFFWFFALANILLISCVLLVLWLCTKYLFKKAFLDVSFGLGDMLFFYAFALGFPTFTFIILFVSAIGFSLIAFTILRIFRKTDSVPLAGLMALYLIGVVLFSFFPNSPSLYLI